MKSTWQTHLLQQLKQFGLNPQDWRLKTKPHTCNEVELFHRLHKDLRLRALLQGDFLADLQLS